MNRGLRALREHSKRTWCKFHIFFIICSNFNFEHLTNQSNCAICSGHTFSILRNTPPMPFPTPIESISPAIRRFSSQATRRVGLQANAIQVKTQFVVY